MEAEYFCHRELVRLHDKKDKTADDQNRIVVLEHAQHLLLGGHSLDEISRAYQDGADAEDGYADARNWFLREIERERVTD
jgi:hypothetical protein